MHVSPLLNRDGKPVVVFGSASKAWKTRPVKDYMTSIEWMADPDTRGRVDAALVIWSAHGSSDRGAWVITRRGVMRFCDEHNRPTPHAFTEARAALTLLGRMPLDMEVNRLVDVVMDCVDDLVQAPATPAAARAALQEKPQWEIIRRDANRRIITETEV